MTNTPVAIRTPLRRSEIGVMRPPMAPMLLANNDEEERRVRRKTILQNLEESRSVQLEENETLKNCMQMFADNKMNKDNVWSLSIIDTLSNLMSNHHRALNNFKVAGSSLEASSRVYGLRVDCVHTDVLRLTHGLSKKKVMDIDAEPDIDEVGGGDNDNEVRPEGEAGENQQKNPKKKKRPRRQVATVTKNPDTINGKFDTTPLADPIWGKFNSVIGGVNSPNHFLQNILFSEGGGLKMTSNYNYWEKEDSEEHSEKQDIKEIIKLDLIDIPKYQEVDLNECVLRATQTGYKITNAPATFDELLQNNDKPEDIEIDDDEIPLPASPMNQQDADDCMAMAFDMEAEVEPVPTEDYAVLNVDIGDIGIEEQEAINLCKGLKKKSVIIEDLRPINSNILEYSYRPLESINRYWAGPSHWNFRNFRKTMAPVIQPNSTAGGKENQTLSIRINAERMKNKSIRNKPKQLNFTQITDDVFQKLDENKLRKTILSKKWDAKKLKLPTNYTYPQNFFDKYTLAPNLSARRFRREEDDEENNNLVMEAVTTDIHEDDDDNHFDDIGGDDMGGNQTISQSQGVGNDVPSTQDVMGGDANKTVMEISDNFIGAPDKVTRIVVPFAKRAKVIDMKQLKRCGLQAINNQLVDTRDQENSICYRHEKYLPGTATFSGIYNKLPLTLSKTMAEGLTPSVALYSVLHLCNENNFRIFPQEDLKDFKIRKLE
ncbi:NCAPH family protein [Megaselia abdita]